MFENYFSELKYIYVHIIFVLRNPGGIFLFCVNKFHRLYFIILSSALVLDIIICKWRNSFVPYQLFEIMFFFNGFNWVFFFQISYSFSVFFFLLFTLTVESKYMLVYFFFFFRDYSINR